MKEQKNVFAVIDLETTGSSYRKGHRIIQIGITILEDEKIVQEYDFTINPGHSIPPLIQNLTGISNHDVQKAPYFEDIAPYVYNLIQNCIFVAHNIAFDYRFLSQAFEDAGMPPLTIKGMDTVELSKILYPALESYRLSDLSKQFSLNHPEIHNAAGDAHATAELFLLLKRKAANLPMITLEKLCSLSHHTQKNNNEFFERCLEISREKKAPKPDSITIRNGIALRSKQIHYEQTSYRLKENLLKESLIDNSFFKKMGYEKRENQWKMMKEIQNFFLEEDKQNLAMEAPTGIGKTLAYLLPAILSANPKKKIIISTSTLLLQEQLLAETLEKIEEKLPFNFQIASLVSKNNLLNLQKFSQLNQAHLSGTDAFVVMSIYVWLTETNTGDLSELSPSHQVQTLFEQIKYSKEDSTITKKWQMDDFYAYSQQKAQQASILVTNHAYLSHHLSDVPIFYSQEEPFLIVDEAHRFPSVFQEKEKVVFPLSSTKRKAGRISEDSRSYREYLEKNATQPFPQYELINFEFGLEHFFENLEEMENILKDKVGLQQNKTKLKKTKEAELFIDREEFADFKMQRIMNKTFRALDEVIMAGYRYIESNQSSEGSQFHNRILSYLLSLEKEKNTLIHFKKLKDTIYYYLNYQIENDIFSCEIVQSDFNLGEELQQQLTKVFQKVLYVSASLLLETNPDYFSKKIGVKNLPAISVHSEIWREKKELALIVPSGIAPVPQIKQKDWTALIADFITELSKETKKKILVLFNSKELLEKVYLYLKEKKLFEDSLAEVLAQGFSGSRRRVHKRFLEIDYAVLLGAGTYWEGIDFPEHPVELLVITRLPFHPPDTPVNLAMKKHYEKNGENVFRQEFLPFMMTRFIQGVGRVARSEKEKGMIVCLDTRILHSSYAPQIQLMLPAYMRVEELPLSDLVKKTREYFEM